MQIIFFPFSLSRYFSFIIMCLLSHLQLQGLKSLQPLPSRKSFQYSMTQPTLVTPIHTQTLFQQPKFLRYLKEKRYPIFSRSRNKSPDYWILKIFHAEDRTDAQVSTVCPNMSEKKARTEKGPEQHRAVRLFFSFKITFQVCAFSKVSNLAPKFENQSFQKRSHNLPTSNISYN